MPDEEYLTVAEAAERFGFTIPRLRRIVSRPPYAERCKTLERETRTGIRTALMLPVSLMGEMGRGPAVPIERKQERERNGRENVSTVTEPIAVYERIIAEKDARIKDLSDALEHERERSRRAAEAHARLQALLALTNAP
jgi:hypothetical protein